MRRDGSSPGRRLRVVLERARACTTCSPSLPHPPRPVVRAGVSARVVVVGQAPSARVHACGQPWQDDSGAHLAEWLGIEPEELLDASRFAVMPMGFCYPGRRKGGDMPPRPECAPQWHASILECLPRISLTLLVGQYAIAGYLGSRRERTLTATVRHFRNYLPEFFPLPHPSWRSRLWIRQNPWFVAEVLPVLRERVRSALGP